MKRTKKLFIISFIAFVLFSCDSAGSKTGSGSIEFDSINFTIINNSDHIAEVFYAQHLINDEGVDVSGYDTKLDQGMETQIIIGITHPVITIKLNNTISYVDLLEEKENGYGYIITNDLLCEN
jgi:hypothetical protein